MPIYKVKVFTGNLYHAHTFNNVYIKLVGDTGESKLKRVTGTGVYFESEHQHDLQCEESLGTLLLIKLQKQSLPLFPTDEWFADKVEVTSPEGDHYMFPIYQWISDEEVHSFCEGKALLPFNEPLEIKTVRDEELKHRKKQFCWDKYEDKMPFCIKTESAAKLPAEVQFSFTKLVEFGWTYAQGLKEMKLSGLANCVEPWTDFDSIHRVFNWHKNDTSKYVYEHWRNDEFFAYQYLNGLNPRLIRKCTSLPENFSVIDPVKLEGGASVAEPVKLEGGASVAEPVKLEGGASLDQELKNGNIFLCDYKILDGVKTNEINGEKQYLMAPLVLLHKTTDNKLKPVAIQLKQQPAEDNPVFVPSDHEYDWLLAKIFVRSAEFNEHQLNAHLLRTHLLAEVFAVSLLRNVPSVHPLFKLLMPHTRYTLNINQLARQELLSKDGFFIKYAASGGEGMITILQRALSSITYSSLCLPDDIEERGVGKESLPNYYYRDDGLKLWNIIHSFVDKVLTHYYKNDSSVQGDTELQAYITDIFEKGFLSNAKSGIPRSFNSAEQLVKFVTMVMFTCSAQHAAVNTGQLDFGNWMPNFPTTLQLAPPTKKGHANEHILLDTLPDVNATVNGIAAVWLLSKQSSDFVPLGQYPRQRFNEEFPLDQIKKFQDALKSLHDEIVKRNKDLDLPYTYLQPALMENSVSL